MHLEEHASQSIWFGDTQAGGKATGKKKSKTNDDEDDDDDDNSMSDLEKRSQR